MDAGLLYVQRLTALAGAADRPSATVVVAAAMGTGQALPKWTLVCI